MAIEEFILEMISGVDRSDKVLLCETQRTSAESIYEVNFRRANASISHQLRYIDTVSWIGGNIAVHMRKVGNPECKAGHLSYRRC